MANPAVNPAAAAALAGPQLAQALNDHDRAKRSTDIPLYYGQPGRDTIAARLLIVRINDAGAITGWDNARKLLEFKMCLRDKAVGWFEGLIEERINVDDWDIIKAEFLETYEPKYSAKTTCTNFTVLNQKSDETINDYTYRVQMAYKRLTDKKPAALAAVRVTIAAGATEAEIKAEGVADAFMFIKHQLFLAGLRDGLRDKVLEMEKPTFTESVKAAHNLETIQNDQKRLNKINAIKQEIGEEKAREIIWEDLPDDQLGQLAVLRFQQKRITNNQACSNTAVRNPNTACRYCQKEGHLQKDCFARKRNKAPMVDANGKPYQNQNGNSIYNVADQNPLLLLLPLLLTPPQRPATRTLSLAQLPTLARIII
jgi:Retrotransposon gag protein